MRYCNHCHRVTAGEPLFCNFCGRSYDFKLCPHRHPNPRSAEVCSQCGSHELSMPHPHVPLWLHMLVGVLSLLPGLALALVTIGFAFLFINAILNSPQIQFQLVIVGLLLSLLWYLYLKLPHALRRLLSRLFRRSSRGDHDH